MIALGHSSVGALIGVGAYQVMPEPIALPVALAIVFVTGLISHYVFDAIPHGHYDFVAKKMNPRMLTLLALDVLGVFVLFLTLSLGTHGVDSLITAYIAAGMIGAQLPDVTEGLIDIGILPLNDILQTHRDFHGSTHWHSPENSPLESGGRPFSYWDVWQALVFLLAILAVISA